MFSPWGLLFSLVSSRSQIYGQLQLHLSRQQRPKPAVIKENAIKDCAAEGRGEKQILQLCERLILFLSNFFFSLLLKAVLMEHTPCCFPYTGPVIFSIFDDVRAGAAAGSATERCVPFGGRDVHAFAWVLAPTQRPQGHVFPNLLQLNTRLERKKKKKGFPFSILLPSPASLDGAVVGRLAERVWFLDNVSPEAW